MKWLNTLIMVTLVSVTMISCKEQVTLEKRDENGVVFQKQSLWEIETVADLSSQVKVIVYLVFTWATISSTAFLRVSALV
jgi:hypothetical protein